MKYLRFSLALKAFLLSLVLAYSCSEDKIDPEIIGHIKGIVTDNSSGEPIADVKITTNPPTISISSDDNGAFVFDGVDIGEYTITTKKTGFRSESVNITVKKDDTASVTILMSRNADFNKPPVITKSPTPKHESINQSVDITLRWNASDPNRTDTLRYDVIVYETLGAQKKFEYINLSDTTLVLEDLDFNTTYFWQVAVHDGYVSTYSPIWKFTTLDLPDNSFLFVREVTGNYELFSSDSSEISLARLTYNSYQDWYPRLDPKRRKIAFISYADLAPHVYLMNRDGSGVEKLSDLPVGGMYNNGIGFCWAHNGDELYYSYYKNIYAIHRDGTNLRVFSTAPEGRNFRELEQSPDGTKFVAAAVSDKIYDTELYLMDGNGKNVTVLIDTLRGIMDSPSFSIDGKNVLFTWDASENLSLTGRQLDARIYTLNLATGVMTDLSIEKEPGTNDLHPRYSPDGAKIIFENVSNAGIGEKSIWIMDYNGENRRKLFSNAIMPDWK